MVGLLKSTSKQAVTAQEVVTDCKLEQTMEVPWVLLEPPLQCCTLFSVSSSILCLRHRFPSICPGDASQEC